METNLSAFVQNLLHCVTNAHILHFQSTSYSQHKALGKFYIELNDLVDSLTEVIQGKYGILSGYSASYDLPTNDPVAYLEQVAGYVEASRRSGWYPQDTNIQNETDNIASLIDSTLYKLRYLK
jgi:hypothetical protein